MLNLLKRMWRGWKALTHRLNRIISWVLMAVAYWIALGPVALIMKLTRRDLLDRGLGDPDAPTWALPVRFERQDIRRAQRPW